MPGACAPEDERPDRAPVHEGRGVEVIPASMVTEHHVNVSELRRTLAELLDRVAGRSASVVIKRHGKDVAALVPMPAYRVLLNLLEQLEDREDVADLAEAQSEETVSFEDLVRQTVADSRDILKPLE